MVNTENKNIQIIKRIYKKIHPVKYFVKNISFISWEMFKGYLLKFGSILIVINLLFLSLISFFHFLLDHSIQIIESWLNLHKWEILIFAKLVSILLFKLWKTSEIKIMKEFFLFEETFKSKYRFSFLVVGLFVLIYYFFLFSQNPQSLESQINLGLLSFRKILFGLLFYLIDLFYVAYFIEDPTKNIFKHIQILIVSFFFFLISSLLIPYKSEYILLSFFIMLNALNIYYFFGKIFLYPVGFIMVNVLLNIIFLGGELISLKANLIANQDFIVSSLIIMHLIIFIYILFKEIKMTSFDYEIEAED